MYPKNADIETQKVAFSLRRKLENLLQSAVTVVSDDKAATKYEMLVGETNRQESAEAYSIVRGYRKNCANDYLVTYINGKVCLAGTSLISLSNAVDYFTEKYFISDKSTVPTDLYHTSRPKLRNFKIGGVQVSKFVIRTEKYP